MNIRFLGAARTVTGSCYLLTHPGMKAVVDCGLVQGGGDARDRNREPFGFDPKEIDILFLTHAHLDHSGRIPLLVKQGFRGRIIATPATADLIGPMLIDSARIQEDDAERLTRKAERRGEQPVEPLYTVEDAERVLPLVDRVPYGAQRDTGKDLKYRFLDAGHILGSGSLELTFPSGGREKKVVLSGDIGKKHTPIIRDPTPPAEGDYVVMESTYGDRLHKNAGDTEKELAEAVLSTFGRGGNVVIPAFAIGRTQDILYILNRMVRDGRLPKLAVYVDSPLAEKATKIYLGHPDVYDEDARRIVAEGPIPDRFVMKFSQSAEESKAINKIKSRAIIIAGSGMCEGGRIKHHLKYNLWRPECSVIFAGFQARGTLGRRIVDGAKTVDIWGDEVAVRAKVWTIGGFSAHADQQGLLDWLSAFRTRPEVFVTHGEESASLAFADLVRQRYGFTVSVPELGEAREL